MISDFI